MKYREFLSGREDYEFNNSKHGLTVVDGNDNEYLIQLNSFGELEITSFDGSILVNPQYSNQILIKTNKY